MVHELRELILTAMQAQGFSQKKLAKESGVSKSYLSSLLSETGVRALPHPERSKVYRQVARTLGLNEQELCAIAYAEIAERFQRRAERLRRISTGEDAPPFALAILK